MVKRIMFLSCLLILTTFVSACQDARDIDRLGISLLMALDIEDEKILLTAEVVDPAYTQQNEQVSQGSSVKYVQGIGNTVYEAFRDIVLKFDRRIFVSHNKVLLFGEELAKRGIMGYVDELFRDREQRETAKILIAKGGKAYDVMGISSGLEKMPSNYISELIQNSKYNSKAADINMIQYLKNYYHKGHHPVVGIIEKRERSPINQTLEKTGTQDHELSIIGSAVFDQDVLVGYLNGNNTKILNLITGEMKEGGLVTFPTPTPLTGGISASKIVCQQLSSIVIIKNKVENDVEIRDGKIVLKSKIKLRGILGEIIGGIDISKRKNIREMEKACAKTVEQNARNMVKKMQEEFGLDLFGYGIVFHRKYPNQWNDIKENWDEIFSEADFEVEVKTKIIRTGLISTPIVNKKEE